MVKNDPNSYGLYRCVEGTTKLGFEDTEYDNYFVKLTFDFEPRIFICIGYPINRGNYCPTFDEFFSSSGYGNCKVSIFVRDFFDSWAIAFPAGIYDTSSNCEKYSVKSSYSYTEFLRIEKSANTNYKNEIMVYTSKSKCENNGKCLVRYLAIG